MTLRDLVVGTVFSFKCRNTWLLHMRTSVGYRTLHEENEDTYKLGPQLREDSNPEVIQRELTDKITIV